MSNYRRCRIGQVFFFTVVTDGRRKILTTDAGRRFLRRAIHSVRDELPFTIAAIVLLPDHLHAVWELPRGDSDYSTRWKLIKSRFTRRWNRSVAPVPGRSESRRKRGEQGIWQRRFFEHACRDTDDLKRCVDYIHVNPLKHAYVERVRDWPWSTFHRYVEDGEYSLTWGNSNDWYGDEFKHFE